MRKKPALTLLCVLALAVGALAFIRRPLPSRPAWQRQTLEIDAHVVYKHLFHHVVALRRKADELEKDGKDAAQFRTHFKRQAQLNDEQARILDEVAAQYDEQEKILDARAKPIIDAYKAQYPAGQVPHGQKPVPPPVELHNLSQERDALALRGRDQLRAAFGYDFDRFDKFIKTRVAADTTFPFTR